jgi:AraC family transcriptional regulator
MNDAIQRAISMMRANYYEPLTLRDVARAALVSPYHFSRMFHASVGVPPGRYLTAVRLFEAKRLLLTTLMNVADIVTTIGYSSVGTFTTRFTRAVGVSPTQFRNPEVSGLLAATALPDVDNPLMAGAPPHMVMPTPRYGGSGSTVGTLVIPAQSEPVEVTVGLIDDLIPRSAQVSSALVGGPLESSLVVTGPATRCVAVALRGRDPRSGMRFAGGVSHSVTVDAGQHLRINVRLHEGMSARSGERVAAVR